MYCYVIYHPASFQVAEFYLSVTRKYCFPTSFDKWDYTFYKWGFKYLQLINGHNCSGLYYPKYISLYFEYPSLPLHFPVPELIVMSCYVILIIIIFMSSLSGWWFGTFFVFPLGTIIPTDSYFSEGQVNHQPDYY